MNQNKKNIKCYRDALACCIICLYVIFLLSAPYLGALDGDFDAYFFGACLSGIAKALSNGELFLWNPHIWGGVSGIGNFTSPFYPVSLFLAKVFYDPSVGLLSYESVTVYYALHYLICLFGFYFLLRECRIRTIPALCGVLLGSTVMGLTYLQISWIPATVLFLIKAVESEKIKNVYQILSGITIGMCLLQGLAQGAVLALILLGGSWIVWICMELLYGKKSAAAKVLRITGSFIIAGVMGLGISAVQLFPVVEQMPELLRVSGSGGFISAGEGVGLADFYLHTASISDLRTMLGGEGNGWCGVLTVFFAVVGMFAKTKYEQNKAQSILANVGRTLYFGTLMLSVSSLMPEYLYYLPFINKLRETYLYVALFPFAVSILVAIGCVVLFKVLYGERDVVYHPIIVLLLCAGIIARGFLPVSANVKSVLSSALLVGLSGCLFFAYRRKQMQMHRLLICVLMVLIGISNVYFVKQAGFTHSYTTASANEKYTNVSKKYQELFLRDGESKAPARIMTWGGQLGCFSSDATVGIGGDYTQGYWEPIYHKVLEAHWNLDFNKSIILNNVKYFVIAEGEEEAYMEWLRAALLDDRFELYDKMENVYPNYDAQEGQTLLVYKNIEDTAGAWMCYEYETYAAEASMEELMAKITAEEFDPMTKVLVEENGDALKKQLETITGKDMNYEVQFTNYTNNTISLDCNTDKNGILCLAESDAKGWKAYIDGEKAELLELDYFRKGLFVEKGHHEIYLKYEPDSFVIGRWISLLTLVFACASLVPGKYIAVFKNKSMKERK